MLAGAAVVIAGSGGLADAARVVAESGDIGAAGHAIVEIDPQGIAPAGWDVHRGDLAEQVAAAVQGAADAVARGDAMHVAVLLHIPLTGSWESDVALDLAPLFAGAFAPTDCRVSLTYEEPIDVSPWPEEVFLEVASMEPEVLRTRLVDAGFRELDAAPPDTLGRSLRMGRELAARCLLALAGEREPEDAVAIVPPSAARPSYAAYLTLAVRGNEDGRFGVERDQKVMTEIQDFMARKGVRVSGIGAGASLPLTPYRGSVRAWREPVRSSRARLPADGERLADTAGLVAAIAAGDERRAADVLARMGRAWIESAQAVRYIEVLKRARVAFPTGSAAGLWAHYLLALDAALRQGAPATTWFTDELCRRAGAHGLEALFRAERMEFARLRGEHADACALASDLLPLLGRSIDRRDPGTVYADATARYVLANVLRRGGRYDLARRYIREAEAAYDTAHPAHAVEATHCRYALAVCDAIDGMPRIFPVDDAHDGQLLFARSLVTLANCQASWFIGEVSRAQRFARDAERGFSGIGYRRYAERANAVAEAMELWLTLEREGDASPTNDTRIRAARAAATGTGAPLDLDALRPSAALTALAFGLRYAPDPAVRRTVGLPRLIEWTSDRGLRLAPQWSAHSIVEADQMLRRAMGIGPGRPIPLLPD